MVLLKTYGGGQGGRHGLADPTLRGAEGRPPGHGLAHGGGQGEPGAPVGGHGLGRPAGDPGGDGSSLPWGHGLARQGESCIIGRVQAASATSRVNSQPAGLSPLDAPRPSDPIRLVCPLCSRTVQRHEPAGARARGRRVTTWCNFCRRSTRTSRWRCGCCNREWPHCQMYRAACREGAAATTGQAQRPPGDGATAIPLHGAAGSRSTLQWLDRPGEEGPQTRIRAVAVSLDSSEAVPNPSFWGPTLRRRFPHLVEGLREQVAVVRPRACEHP